MVPALSRTPCFPQAVATRLAGAAAAANRWLRGWMGGSVLLVGLAAAMTAEAAELRWDTLPPLPPSAGQTVQPGVASPFVGVHGDVLLVAGGANFPDRMPWEGGAKVWWDDIWVLERRAGGTAAWVADKRFKLPRKIGYGVSVSTPDGVVCVGGSDAERCHAEVFMLAWDAAAREVRRTPLPALPEPLSFMAGALAGSVVYVAGGQHTMKDARATAVFWALDLTKRGRPDFAWKKLPTWPGPARILAAAAGQRTAAGERFFLFGGRAPEPGKAASLFVDAYVFDAATERWRKLPNVGGGAGVSVMAASAAVAAGDTEVLVFGGDRGELFRELEAHDLAIAAARQKLAGAGAVEKPALEQEIAERLQAKLRIYGAHPGFSRDVLAFDVRSETWRLAGRAPAGLPVTTTAVVWGDAIVIPSGEIRPGVRTPGVIAVMRIQNTETRR